MKFDDKMLKAVDFLVESKVGTSIKDIFVEKKSCDEDSKGDKKKEKAEEDKKKKEADKKKADDKKKKEALAKKKAKK